MFTPANIAGFQVNGTSLTPIANSSKNLSSPNPGPAQIQFTPDGTLLVVTEKMTNKIDTFTVTGGLASGPMVQASNGTLPCGFAFSATQKLLVAENENGMTGQGSASSYTLASSGTLTSVSSQLTSGQSAPCWMAVSGTTAYVTNAFSNNISAYKVAADGTLTLLASGNSAMTGMYPTDEAVSEDNAFLYVLNSRDHSLSIYSINQDGSLNRFSDYLGLPMLAEGLAAR
jgi:6-phosphogluconolactonase (cycloisomerase 2 family)